MTARPRDARLMAAAAVAAAALIGIWVLGADRADPGGWALWGRWRPEHFAVNLAATWVLVCAVAIALSRTPVRALGRAALATASVLLVVGGAELAALLGVHFGRVLPLPEHVAFTRIKPWNHPANLRDDELIFRHRPGLHFRGSVPGDLVPLYGIATDRRYDVDVRYDRNGFRNPTDLDRADLVLIGDSFLESGLVASDDLVSERLARELGWVAANLGVSGYGPQQELVVLKRYGLPLDPKVVLWFFFEGNDLLDVERYQRFAADPENALRSGDRFAERSFIANALRWAAARSEPPRRIDAPEATRRSCRFPRARSEDERVLYFAFESQPLAERDLRRFAVARRAIEAAREICRRRGVDFALVYVPIKFRVFAPHCEIAPDSRLAGWQLHDLPARMQRFAAQRGIPFVDLTTVFQRAAAGGEAAHFPDDGHWNATGHALAAEAIADLLRDHVGSAR